MEILGPLCLLGGFFAFVIFIFAWSLYLAPKRDGERWASTAAELGLTLEPRNAGHSIGLWSGTTIKQVMFGERGGMPVRAGVRIVVRGTGKNRRTYYYTYVEAGLPRSLELGLSVAPSSWLASAIGDLFAGKDLQVGHPELDARYRIGASIADLARALLRAPPVADALLGLSRARFAPWIDDATVKLEAQGKYLDARELSRALDACVDLAHRLVSARTAIGLGNMQRVLAEHWRPVAESLGLAIDYDRCVMSGRCEGMHVEVHGLQRGDRYGTSFVVRFDRPLGIGLRLERQEGWGAKLGGLVGMKDIEVGDRAFDDRFIVRGSPEAAVRAALTHEVRGLLVQIQEHSTSLAVEDAGLRADVDWLVNEPSWLTSAIRSIARAGAVLTGTSLASAGAYR